MQSELAATFQQQAYYFQEVFVPPHSNAVFRDPAEPRHDPFIQIFVQGLHVLDWRERPPLSVNIHPRKVCWQRLNF